MIRHYLSQKVHGDSMDKNKENIFFVEVHEPAEIRRNILETLKEIVENLQRFEKFKEIRKDKLEQIAKLGRIIREINKLIPQLKTGLPEIKVRAAKPEHIRVPKKKAESKSEEEVKERPISEMQKLEAELSEIEEKLGNL